MRPPLFSTVFLLGEEYLRALLISVRPFFQSDVELVNLRPCRVESIEAFPEEVRVEIQQCEKVPEFSKRDYHQAFDELDFWIGSYQGGMDKKVSWE